MWSARWFLMYTNYMKSAKSLRFRKIKKSDEQIFRRWWRDRRLIHMTSGNIRAYTDVMVHRNFEIMRHSRRADHWMIEHQKKIIGHVSVLKSGTIPEIQIVIGNTNNWGRGYGNMVGQWLFKRARRDKTTAAKMHVWVNNRRSIALGKKFGFKPIRIFRRRVGNRYRKYLLMKALIPK